MAIKISEIHEVTDELAEAINQLLPQLAPSHAPLSQEALARIVASPCCTLLVASDANVGGDQIVGTLSLVTSPLLSGVRARIEDLVVERAWRGRGVGEALVREALNLATTLGVSTIGLTCRPSREDANHLYRRMGFIRRNTNVYSYDLGNPRRTP
ncbi:MAG: GNAT family N-acetyltransferase [Planctomycetes bacterium]|nr:GNAT family N-acetyltransferase [Planctomycetota bacterium]